MSRGIYVIPRILDFIHTKYIKESVYEGSEAEITKYICKKEDAYNLVINSRFSIEKLYNFHDIIADEKLHK
jgi:hypothetical protein